MRDEWSDIPVLTGDLHELRSDALERVLWLADHKTLKALRRPMGVAVVVYFKASRKAWGTEL